MQIYLKFASDQGNVIAQYWKGKPELFVYYNYKIDWGGTKLLVHLSCAWLEEFSEISQMINFFNSFIF